MTAATRFFTEYAALAAILEPRELLALAKVTVQHAPEIWRSRRLTVLDAAMSRNLTVHFGKTSIALPLADIDRILAPHGANPTFGNVREMYARDCYLRRLRIESPVHAVLDLGANRGMFSLLALTALRAEIAVSVEPVALFASIHRLLLDANGCSPDRGPRYIALISTPSVERHVRQQNISIETILREQHIDRFNLVKIDIEGNEEALFSEPAWLAQADNLTMELHPASTDDLTLIPSALKQYGFQYMFADQAGKPCDLKSAMFLYASCTGAIIA